MRFELSAVWVKVPENGLRGLCFQCLVVIRWPSFTSCSSFLPLFQLFQLQSCTQSATTISISVFISDYVPCEFFDKPNRWKKLVPSPESKPKPTFSSFPAENPNSIVAIKTIFSSYPRYRISFVIPIRDTMWKLQSTHFYSIFINSLSWLSIESVLVLFWFCSDLALIMLFFCSESEFWFRKKSQQNHNKS